MAHVQRVVPQGQVVGPDVERDRQGHRRVDPRCRRVQGELADRDGHPAGALVAQSEDPLVVGHNDEAHVGERCRPQDRRDTVDVVGGYPDPAGAPDDVAELLARPAHGRRVHDRQELLEVLGKHAVEERRVAVLERGEADVLLEIVGLAPDVLDFEGDLVLDGEDAVGQEAAQAELDALLLAEREILREQAPPEQIGPRLLDRDRLAGDHPVEGRRQGSHPAKDRAGTDPAALGAWIEGHDGA